MVRGKHRMVRTIKEATVKAFHYTSIIEMRGQVGDSLAAYNIGKRLKALFHNTLKAASQVGSRKQRSTGIKPAAR